LKDFSQKKLIFLYKYLKIILPFSSEIDKYRYARIYIRIRSHCIECNVSELERSIYSVISFNLHRRYSMLLCECGEIIDGYTFRDYIQTSANPSTPTIGHQKCGYIFNFIDGKMPKRYSSKIELKGIAMKFAEKNKMSVDTIERMLIQIDRMKSTGTLSDGEILAAVIKKCCKDRRSF
jgi:hypothetical protein